MTTNRQPRPPSPLPGGAATGELKRIPLPPLPHFRRPGADQPAGAPAASPATPPAAARPAGAVSHLEMSELLAPGHEGGITPVIEATAPQRTGSTGATILNNLVDEIEKGLERDLARVPPDIVLQQYRRVVPCSLGPRAAPERRARP